MKRPFLLVAEDEASIQRLVCENLEAEGYRTAAVDHGEAALRAAQDVDIDLILLDVMLPGMDGFEGCRRLRKLGNRTPILFLTARDLPRDRVEGLQAGGDDYLVKPFHLDELLARIAALLRRVGWEKQPITGQITIGEGWVDLQT
ncbi:MAG: response regulator, partial [Planctomycetes bacterium]|nr:response regulator [Planctomycetota bacterium]